MTMPLVGARRGKSDFRTQPEFVQIAGDRVVLHHVRNEHGNHDRRHLLHGHAPDPRRALPALRGAHRGAGAIQSMGGVDAAKKVREGEATDIVILASGPMAKLEAEGHLVPAASGASPGRAWPSPCARARRSRTSPARRR
ncbi:MAG: hypothetical protein WDN45_16995 [Caulobacteraceae bacterium]